LSTQQLPKKKKKKEKKKEREEEQEEERRSMKNKKGVREAHGRMGNLKKIIN
jgi:hypothetical protein